MHCSDAPLTPSVTLQPPSVPLQPPSVPLQLPLQPSNWVLTAASSFSSFLLRGTALSAPYHQGR